MALLFVVAVLVVGIVFAAAFAAVFNVCAAAVDVFF